MIYTWKVVNTTIKDSQDLSKAVVNCSWVKRGQDDNGNQGQYYGSTRFDINDINQQTFVPFDQLTEEVVLSWIQSRISDELNQQIDTAILEDMNRNMYPETTVIPPWD